MIYLVTVKISDTNLGHAVVEAIDYNDAKTRTEQSGFTVRFVQERRPTNYADIEQRLADLLSDGKAYLIDEGVSDE